MQSPTFARDTFEGDFYWLKCFGWEEEWKIWPTGAWAALLSGGCAHTHSGLAPSWRQHFYSKAVEFLCMFPLGFVLLEPLVTLYFGGVFFFLFRKKKKYLHFEKNTFQSGWYLKTHFLKSVPYSDGLHRLEQENQLQMFPVWQDPMPFPFLTL